jgi:hypothetical protein
MNKPTFHRSVSILARNPSKVVDMDGPTPTRELDPPEVIDSADIYGLDTMKRTTQSRINHGEEVKLWDVKTP